MAFHILTSERPVFVRMPSQKQMKSINEQTDLEVKLCFDEKQR